MKHGIEKVVVNRDVLLNAREVYQKNETIIERYIDEILQWNDKINLVSRTVSRETIREHVVHSLLPIPLSLLNKHNKWIDSGTGGGIPGMPLAICEKGKTWQLNDNVKKKIKAVDDIISSIKLKNVTTLPHSISLVELKKGTGILSKHAFKIPDLLRLLGTKPWTTILLWKGAKDAEEEIIRSRKKLNCKIYEFNFGENEPFYKGKGLVLIER